MTQRDERRDIRKWIGNSRYVRVVKTVLPPLKGPPLRGAPPNGAEGYYSIDVLDWLADREWDEVMQVPHGASITSDGEEMAAITQDGAIRIAQAIERELFPHLTGEGGWMPALKP